MKMKIIGLVCLILLVLYGIISYITPYSKTETLEDGKFLWQGGVDNKYVYSSLTDLEDDEKVLQGRAWVENSMWQHNYSEIRTTGVGKKGRIYVKVNKSWLPGMVNKSGYKNVLFVDEHNEEHVE